MSTEYCMVMTTTGTQNEAEKLSKLMVKNQLAACVQVMPITSYYTWQNALQEDREYFLLIKTIRQHFLQIEAMILKNHSYDIPEIIQILITQGSAPYLGWLAEHTQPSI